jgi:hypothetical protein
MSFFISICEDLNALKATGLVDEESLLRGMIDSRSGSYVCHNLPVDPTKSMIIISSLEGQSKRLTKMATYCGGRTIGCSHRHTRSLLIIGWIRGGWTRTDLLFTRMIRQRKLSRHRPTKPVTL